MPDIFAFTSYARFLREYYAEKKAENPKFSYETLSRKAGIKSRSNLIEDFSGKKELTNSRIFAVYFSEWYHPVIIWPKGNTACAS